MSLQGKTALVTGSSRNIGKAIALAFAKEGANVVVNAVSRMDDARAVAEEAEREHGVKALAIQADVSDGGQVAAMIEQANGAFGGVDILVNNPKWNPQRSFVDMPYEDWRKAMGVMLDGAFFCIQGVLPHMIEKGWGRIINISAARRLPRAAPGRRTTSPPRWACAVSPAAWPWSTPRTACW